MPLGAGCESADSLRRARRQREKTLPNSVVTPLVLAVGISAMGI
jgi:hypothetical protein